MSKFLKASKIQDEKIVEPTKKQRKFPKTPEEQKQYYLSHPAEAVEYVKYLLEEKQLKESEIDYDILVFVKQLLKK